VRACTSTTQRLSVCACVFCGASVVLYSRRSNFQALLIRSSIAIRDEWSSGFRTVSSLQAEILSCSARVTVPSTSTMLMIKYDSNNNDNNNYNYNSNIVHNIIILISPRRLQCLYALRVWQAAHPSIVRGQRRTAVHCRLRCKYDALHLHSSNSP